MREKILFSGLIILFVLHTMAIAQVGENESYYDDRFYWGGLGGSVENLFEVDGELYMSGRFHTYRGDHSISDFLKWNGERWVSAGKKQNLDNTSFLFLYNDEIHKISYSDLDNNEGLTKWTGDEWEVVNSDNYYGWLRDTESFEGDLIVGGTSHRIGDTYINRVARWDGSNWHRMGDGFDDMNVIDLEVFKGQLLASGFANVFYRGEFAYYKKAVKAWDGEKWINFHSNLIDSTTIRIDHLVSFNEKLYGYESYYSSKGNESDFGRIFEWDDESKTKKDITIEPDDSTIGLQVGFLSKVNERLIASYSFKKEDGPNENFIAEWSEGQWKQIGKQFRGRIAVVSSYKNSFVAAEIISGRPNHLRIHVFKEGQWSTLEKDDENGLGLNNTVAKVLEFKDQIIVGGKFSGTAAQELNHIAQWDGETWSQLGNGLNGSVSDISIHMGRLVAVQEKEKVFELIDDQWKELSLNIADTDIINKIISYKDTLIAVGRIEGKNGEFNNIIKWNGETWQRQGEIEVGLGSLNTLSKSGGNLITSGDGLVDNGSCIYQWDGEDWQQMSTDFLDYDFNNHGIAPRLTAVFEHQGDIYGAVRIAGFEKIAVLSNGIWRLVNPSSSSDAKHVKGLVSHGGYLMGWGYFESGYPVVENQSSIASWNNGHWQESPTKLYQFSEYSSESSECDNNQCLNSMIVTDNGIYAGGDFSRIGYIKASNFVHIKPEWNAVVVSNEENVSNHIPNDFQLYQNYPNPFNPSTTIKYSIPKAMEVRVNIYNMIGQKVKTVENVFKSAGTHQLSIDGSNMSSGVYLYRVKAGETVKSGRMILLK